MSNVWKDQITSLYKCENLSFMHTVMVTETKNFVFLDEDFTQFMDHIFASFGVNRILFGSDWPICLLTANYNKVFSDINDYIEHYFTKTKMQVFGVNSTIINNL